MSSPYDQEIAELTAEYQRRREGLGDMQRGLRAIAATATAPRQVVQVTVGHGGEVTELKFPTNAYRRMAPVELATTILATIAEAREKALGEASALLAPMLPPGFDARAMFSGETELDTLLPEEPVSFRNWH
ncbi:YbaB/EbfC family nucleoid-associated protein [Amycolatopsis sp. H20-H5]|uniref:YbaB/EbfC family nucleoid-associated protein n=1 Tax=Amycolatopsis sp. H20-H5 TaxID=3046309 RepID=UPI002DBC7B57|nr:YbaB/EbfC family nucleoid-associated protein [Amycolatopsis sp. H20-H5]MEC3980606.1 YbaB/EbfC family nucleoid-associated protein [Amycolatopsis sp. H20-H5]